MVLVNPMELPADLPVPQDDGGARHLPGMRAPDLPLPATDGNPVNLGQLSGRTIVYVYPRTGRPGVPLPEGWDAIPGARGCTPQSCGFRDRLQELILCSQQERLPRSLASVSCEPASDWNRLAAFSILGSLSSAATTITS